MKKIKLIHCLLLLLLGSAAEAKPNCVAVGGAFNASGQGWIYYSTWCCENNGTYYGVTVYHASGDYNNIWTGVEIGCGNLRTQGSTDPFDIDLNLEKDNAEELLMKKIGS